MLQVMQLTKSRKHLNFSRNLFWLQGRICTDYNGIWMCVCVFAYRIDLSNNLKLFRHDIIKWGRQWACQVDGRKRRKTFSVLKWMRKSVTINTLNRSAVCAVAGSARSRQKGGSERGDHRGEVEGDCECETRAKSSRLVRACILNMLLQLTPVCLK